MLDIKVVEKPSWVDYEQIHDVLYSAHLVNQKKGFIMRTSNLSGKQLKERIGKSGKCWIALDGDKIIGTISIRLVKRNTWYANGEIPDYMLAAVIPEYQGKHINSMLAQKVFEYAEEKGYSIIELDTAERNTHAIEVYKHQGFQLVDYKAMGGLDHYSVVMVKWMKEKPFSKTYCRFRYELKRFYVRIRYKKGGMKRFGI